jgi:hypothetical protein
MPPSPAPGAGAAPITIRMRVTGKGDGQIHTGEVDPARMRALKFAEGEEFECLAENVETYESRGIAIRVAAAPGLAPQPSPPPQPIDGEAIARLLSRAHRDERTGCLVWQGSKAKGGYGQITYRRMLLRTHRLAFEAHHGPVPAGHYVCHACDNPACIAIEHLFLGTPQENYRDMRRKGRARSNAKLAPEELDEIRRRLAAGESATAIAKGARVRYDQILAIKNGRAWKDG